MRTARVVPVWAVSVRRRHSCYEVLTGGSLQLPSRLPFSLQFSSIHVFCLEAHKPALKTSEDKIFFPV